MSLLEVLDSLVEVLGRGAVLDDTFETLEDELVHSYGLSGVSLELDGDVRAWAGEA